MIPDYYKISCTIFIVNTKWQQLGSGICLEPISSVFSSFTCDSEFVEYSRKNMLKMGKMKSYILNIMFYEIRKISKRPNCDQK